MIQPGSKPKPSPPKSKKKVSVAREAEAEDGFVTVEHRGLRMKVPVMGKVPVKAAMAFRSGDNFGGTQLLLGHKQWDRFIETDPTLDDFEEIWRQINEATGNS